MPNYKKYYLRDDVKKRILSFSKSREIAVLFDAKYYGKRPMTINTSKEYDIIVKKGATSFHCGEERWENPLILGSDIGEQEFNENKIGWDLVLDIDGVDFIFSKIVACEILSFLKNELDVNYTSIKFSGNKGFHLGIPFEAFAGTYMNEDIKNLFPQIPRNMANYIVSNIKDKVSVKILEIEKSLENISKKYNINVDDLLDERGKLDSTKLVDVDTILISHRHLFRMPFSINEKSGLVSIPVNPDKIADFNRDDARVSNLENLDVYDEFLFLDYNQEQGKYAKKLFEKSMEEIESFEDIQIKLHYNNEKKNEVIIIDEKVPEKNFPQTIKYILNNKFDDGRKRLVFVLLSFLVSVNWDFENIEKVMREWARKQNLQRNYLRGQINWFKNANKKINPPNFNRDEYFVGLGVPQKVIDEDVNFENRKNKNLLFCIRK